MRHNHVRLVPVKLSQMKRNNFKCKDCGNEYFVSKYAHHFVDGDLVLYGTYYCPECASTNTCELPRPKTNYNFGVPAYGKFSSASDEKKKEILQKRADDHYNRKGKEEKRERFKATMKKLKNN